MSLSIKIQAKAEQILQSEARFYGVTATAIAKAIIDKVVAGDLVRDVLQGVDVASYQQRERKPEHGKEVYRFRGVNRTLKEIQALTGVSSVLIKSRLDRGWKLERAATTPPNVKFRRKLEAEL
ncbi:hypothetical protein GOB91_29210 [Sinorhizobium meliloti]|nr:hypothetical protein [Sinorhizobium meliloti]MDW9732634.1 hypothetical protein [Sinorhizobium meliloti]